MRSPVIHHKNQIWWPDIEFYKKSITFCPRYLHLDFANRELTTVQIVNLMVDVDSQMTPSAESFPVNFVIFLLILSLPFVHFAINKSYYLYIYNVDVFRSIKRDDTSDHCTMVSSVSSHIID